MTMTAASGLSLDMLASDIRARVAAGDRDAKRSEDHYKAAGIQLIEAKARVAVELPEVFWPIWVARNFPQIGYSRVDQIMRIGRGETTQSEINAESAAAHRRSYTPAPRSFAENIRARMDAMRVAQRDTCAHASRETQSDAERQRRRRRRQREARVAAGADLPPPLAPIEHRRLLKEWRDRGAALSFNELKATLSRIPDPTVVDRSGDGPSPEQYRFAYFTRVDGAIKFAFLPEAAPKPDQEKLDWAIRVAAKWTEFSQKLKERMDDRAAQLVEAEIVAADEDTSDEPPVRTARDARLETMRRAAGLSAA